MVGRPQCQHRLSLCAGRRRAGPGARERASRPATRRDLRRGDFDLRRLAAESRTIPIVFVGVSDPIGSGFIASLARPGGNITGRAAKSRPASPASGSRCSRRLRPRLARAAFVANPKMTAYDYFLRAAEALARRWRSTVPSPVENAADIERVIGSFARVPNGGLVCRRTSRPVNRDLIISLAAQHRLPAVYTIRSFVAAGGLMS